MTSSKHLTCRTGNQVSPVNVKKKFLNNYRYAGSYKNIRMLYAIHQASLNSDISPMDFYQKGKK